MKRKPVAIIAALAIVVIGIVEIALATSYFIRGQLVSGPFVELYTGLWTFIVGSRPYISAILAGVIWLILAVVAFIILNKKQAKYCGMCGKKVGLLCAELVGQYDKRGKKIPICAPCFNGCGKDRTVKYDPDSDKVKYVTQAEYETRKKCNVCGNVFCYSPQDVAKNVQRANQAILSGVTGVATAASGHLTASAVNQSSADNQLNNIVDYNKCPKCNSTDLRVLSSEEFQKEMQSANAPTASSADELKKFKDLLDSGVITQEEFDAKKKQLLGL